MIHESTQTVSSRCASSSSATWRTALWTNWYFFKFLQNIVFWMRTLLVEKCRYKLIKFNQTNDFEIQILMQSNSNRNATVECSAFSKPQLRSTCEHVKVFHCSATVPWNVPREITINSELFKLIRSTLHFLSPKSPVKSLKSLRNSLELIKLN